MNNNRINNEIQDAIEQFLERFPSDESSEDDPLPDTPERLSRPSQLRRNPLRNFVSGILEFSNYFQNDQLINRLMNPSNESAINPYNNEDYDLATTYFYMLREVFVTNNDINIGQIYNHDIAQNYFVGKDIQHVLLNFYNMTPSLDDQHFPNYSEFIDELYKYRCPCCQYFSERQVKRVFELYSFIYGDLMKCQDTPFYIEYYILHGRIPNQEEFMEFYRRNIEFYRSPEEFHQTDKIKVPALGVDKLPRFTYLKTTEEESCCGICQYDFEDKQEIIKLKPCGHEFHYSNKDCLEEGSILTWLENNNFCPLCKKKVES